MFLPESDVRVLGGAGSTVRISCRRRIPCSCQPRGEGGPVLGDAGDHQADRPAELLVTARTALAEPGLVVLTGGPGVGRSTALRRLGETFRGPVFAGGGLAMLRAVPGFALARAVKVRLPGQGRALLAAAVRSPGRGGVFLPGGHPGAGPGA